MDNVNSMIDSTFGVDNPTLVKIQTVTQEKKDLVKCLIKSVRDFKEDTLEFLRSDPDKGQEKLAAYVQLKDEKEKELANLGKGIDTTMKNLEAAKTKKEDLARALYDVSVFINNLEHSLKAKSAEKKMADQLIEDLRGLIKAFQAVMDHKEEVLTAAWKDFDTIRQEWGISGFADITGVARHAETCKTIAAGLKIDGLEYNISFTGKPINLTNTALMKVEEWQDALAKWFQVPKNATEALKREQEQIVSSMKKRRRVSNSSFYEGDNESDNDDCNGFASF